MYSSHRGNGMIVAGDNFFHQIFHVGAFSFVVDRRKTEIIYQKRFFSTRLVFGWLVVNCLRLYAFDFDLDL